MKKITSKLLVMVMVLTMAFGLAACGGDKKSTTTSGTGGDSSSSTSSTYNSVEEYVNSAEVQSALKTLEQQQSGNGMNIKVTAEGDKMIYTFKYENTEKTDGMAEALEAAIETQDATFQNTADQIKKYVNVDTATVVIKYIDSKDEMIFTKEYTSK